MSAFKSVTLLATSLKPKVKISRRRLRKYSWLPDVLRIKGSILPRIAGPVLTVTLFATAIATAHAYGYNVTLTNSVTPLLAVVVGLILVFRNTTSYDRYYEGRKDFGLMMSNIRNLARLIWVNVNTQVDANGPSTSKSAFRFTTPPSQGEKASLSPENLKLQKIRCIKLALAYAFSIKHHLRGEEGVDWPDYAGLLPSSFDEFGVTRPVDESYSSIGSKDNDNRGRSVGQVQVKPSESQVVVPNQSTPLLADSHQTVEFHPCSDDISLPLPMMISHEITRVLYSFRRHGYLDVIGPAGFNAMMSTCSTLCDQLTAMERIANTPIPPAYGIHLKQCVSLYLFALPFTLVKDLGWRMIPVVTVVAITLMGIEGIADELEMPFGYDMCDLPLDKYCKELRNEVEHLMARLPQGIEESDPFAD